MRANGFHFSNSATHLITGFSHNWHTLFGVFHAKGYYLEIIAFGRAYRVCAAPGY